MPTIDPKRQRAFALEVVRRLRAAGFETYWAGGCVRDELLGRQPKDYDVASSAPPTEIRRVFGHRRTLAIGAAFGVITVLGPKQAGQIEVATFRADDRYSDGRHPDRVQYSSPEVDAQRRDFTINGLFYDPQQQRLIDYIGGQDDLKRGLIRAIGAPHERFDQDRLRMLRAVRFAAAFQFELEAETLRCVQEMAGGIELVSAERIGMEMQLMLLHPTRADAMRLLRLSGLLGVVLPELAAIAEGSDGGTPWQETLRVLAALRTPALALALAALLHQIDGAPLVQQVGKRWRLANKHTQRASWLVEHYRQVGQATTMDWPKLQPLLISAGIEQLLALHQAVAGRATPQLAHCRERLALPPEQLNPPPLLTGDDLIAHGIRPGSAFRLLLDRVREAQLSETVGTRDEALRLVDRLLAEGRGAAQG